MPDFNEHSLTELLHDHGLVEHRYHSSAPPDQHRVIAALTQEIAERVAEPLRQELEAEVEYANNEADEYRRRYDDLFIDHEDLKVELDKTLARLEATEAAQ